MKKIFIALVTIGILSSSSPVKEKETESNSDKWESLFDGETLNGWHRFNRKGVAPVWTIIIVFNCYSTFCTRFNLFHIIFMSSERF